MKVLRFEEVAALINHSRITEIDLNPVKQEIGKWALYHGVNKVPHFKYDFYVLYLYSDLTRDTAYNAAKALIDPATTQIVHASSVRKTNLDELQKHIRGSVAGIRETKNYLLSFVQDQLGKYSQKLQELKPKYFVDPAYETPSGLKRRYPNPVMSFLNDTMSEISGGSLGVLLAEPGQGKTYTTQYLATELHKHDIIPIYIHSPQWFEMKEGDLTSVWKTITHSFKFFESPIDWIDGSEREFLDVTLKAGLFRIIFDGFDEYILWNAGKIDANEIYRNLIELAIVSESRILLTSRTSFWQSNISDDVSSSAKPHSYIYRILPFDHNHARNYFHQRFPNNERATTRAIAVYDRVKKANSEATKTNLAGRGFILNLIADLSSTEASLSTEKTELSTLRWIMEALCQREMKRQKLPINAKEQLQILRLFVEEVSCGSRPTSQTLRDIITVCADNLTDTQISSLVGEGKSKYGSLQDHALIQRITGRDEWEFKHEQIYFNLLAEQIISYARDKSYESLRGFFDRLRVTGSLLDDLATSMVEQICAPYEAEGIRNKALDIIDALLKCCSPVGKSAEQNRNELVLATTIAFNTLNQLCPIGKERIERTDEFIRCFPERQLANLQFRGTISNMDFGHVSFVNCRFDNVIWANCRFSEKTVFEKCSFLGGKIVHCELFGKVQFRKSFFDSSSEAIVNAEKISVGEKEYTRDTVRKDMTNVLDKFFIRDGVGLKTVHEDNLARGLIGKSIHKDTIIEIMSKRILEKHAVSSISGHAFKIQDGAKDSVLNYINNGVFTGVLSEAYGEICKKLKL